MNYTIRRFETSSLLALAATLTVILTSCQSPHDGEYTLPRTFCGLPLGRDAYEPLFKPGKKVDFDKYGTWGDLGLQGQGCQYYIDDSVKVWMKGNWRETGAKASPATPEDAIKELTKEKPRRFEGKYEAATWSRGGVAAAVCKRPKGAEDRYLVEIQARDVPLNDQPKRANKVFGRLAQAAMAKVEDKLPCEGK